MDYVNMADTEYWDLCKTEKWTKYKSTQNTVLAVDMLKAAAENMVEVSEADVLNAGITNGAITGVSCAT